MLHRIDDFLSGRPPRGGRLDVPVEIWGMTWWDDERRTDRQWKSYCNPTLATDGCLKECACAHENVHEAIGPVPPANLNNPVDARLYWQREVPAYTAGRDCALRLLGQM